MNTASKAKQIVAALSPTEKAAKTARWAITMAKAFISIAGKDGVKWRLVEFGGVKGTESRGIVDVVAIRKNHKKREGYNNGDLFDIVLIQSKGGSAAPPTLEDKKRLKAVARYHRAKAIVLVEWKRKEKLKFSRLEGMDWKQFEPAEIFGKENTKNARTLSS